jgi:hypothetical protein
MSNVVLLFWQTQKSLLCVAARKLLSTKTPWFLRKRTSQGLWHNGWSLTSSLASCSYDLCGFLCTRSVWLESLWLRLQRLCRQCHIALFFHCVLTGWALEKALRDVGDNNVATRDFFIVSCFLVMSRHAVAGDSLYDPSHSYLAGCISLRCSSLHLCGLRGVGRLHIRI